MRAADSAEITDQRSLLMKVVADDKIPFLKGVLEPYAEVVYLPGSEISAHDVRDANAILTRTRTKCNAALLEGSSVRFIGTATIGYDHIDAAYCKSKQISWTSAPGCNAASVAQYMASLLLCDAQKNSISLRGKTLGIIGVGNVGSQVARIGNILGMKLLLCDPPRKRNSERGVITHGLYGNPATFVSLETILEEADYLTLHVPLNREREDRTFHLGDSAFFQQTRKHPFLINASRGEVVSTEALKTALITNRLRAAALDVWENEPDIDLELMGLLDYATPHIAGYSLDGKANGTSAVVRACSRFFGLPLTDFSTGQIQMPPPDHPVLDLTRSRNPLGDAVMATYDIRNDDISLRSSPESFEKLRGNYPVRREFMAFSIAHASSLSGEVSTRLNALGFKLQSN